MKQPCGYLYPPADGTLTGHPKASCVNGFPVQTVMSASARVYRPHTYQRSYYTLRLHCIRIPPQP